MPGGGRGGSRRGGGGGIFSNAIARSRAAGNRFVRV